MLAGGLNPSVLEYVRASGFADRLGPERLFFNAELALQSHLTSLKSSGTGQSTA